MAKSRKVPAVTKTLVIFCNTAKIAHTDDEKAHLKEHRDNSPWYVFFPALAVSILAKNPDGTPIIGYWSDSEAVPYAISEFVQLVSDKEYLAEVRSNPEVPSKFNDLPDMKIMARTITVPVLG